MTDKINTPHITVPYSDDLTELKLFVPDDLYRAFQRCTWIIVQETGRSRLDIMEEAVKDFLIKYDC